MKAILTLAATLFVAISLPASPQTQPNMAVAPADRSTGPTVPPPRSMELNTAVQPSTGFGSSANDRLAAGNPDTDPYNPTATPSQSSRLGASPTR